MNRWALAIFSFRRTIITVFIVGFILTFFELEAFTTYVVAVFVSLVHPFYEKLERISKNFQDERDEVYLEAKEYFSENTIISIRVFIIVVLVLGATLAIFERWPFLIDWILPK